MIKIKEKKYFYISLLFLLLNVFFLDFIYILNIGGISNFDPIVGNEDYLRHHSIAKQVAERQGFFSIYDSTLNELPYIYGQPVTSIFYGFLIFISNDNHIFTFFITLFLFSILSFIFLSFFINKIIENEKNSYLYTTILLITGNFIFSFWYLIPKGVIQIDSLIMLHRIANPLISYPILFIFMYFLYKYYESYLKLNYAEIRKNSFYLGIIFFILMFSYFYFWTFAFVSFGLVNLFLLFNKNRKIMIFLKSGLYFSIFAIPAFIIYIYNSYLQNNILFYKEYLERNSVVFTHSFLSSEYELFYLLILFLILLILIYLYKKNIVEKLKLNFLSILIASSYICLYNNVITGLSVQKGHWFAFLTYLFFLLLLLILINHVYEKYNLVKFFRFKNIFLIILLIITLFNLIFITYIGVNNYSNFVISNSEKDLFIYLNSVEERKFILADKKMSKKIVGFTIHDTVFVDEIEKVSNIEFEKRQKAFEMYLNNCDISYKFDYLIIENNSIDCLNLKIEKEFNNIKLYKKID